MKLNRVKLALVAMTLALLAGCAAGPDYVRPDVETPSGFKELKGWKTAEPRDHELRGNWWELFGDPLLSSLVEQVSISNQNLAQAEAQFRQARALVQQSRAGYFPTVSANLSVTRSRESSGSSRGSSSNGVISNGPTTSYSAALDATWEIDVWGRVRRLVESNQAGAQAGAADLETARLSAQAPLVGNYFQLRALDAQKKLLDDTVAAYERSLKLTQNRYAAGVAARTDVIQAQTQLETTQAQAIDVGVQRAQLEHAIALLVGKPASVLSIPISPLTAIEPPVPTAVPSELLERRPDIAAAERRMAAANAQIGVAKAAFFPAITLSASAGFESLNLAHLFSAPSRFWAVGPALAQILFDGGLRRAQTEQAIAAYDGDVAAYRQTVLTAFQEVEDNLAALQILEQEAQVQDEAVRAARQSVELTLNQYKAGTVSYLNVVTVQATALANERTAVDILGRRLSASALLIKALGGSWNASSLPQGADLAQSR